MTRVHAIMSGRDQTLAGYLARVGLSALEPFYHHGSNLRNILFDAPRWRHQVVLCFSLPSQGIESGLVLSLRRNPLSVVLHTLSPLQTLAEVIPDFVERRALALCQRTRRYAYLLAVFSHQPLTGETPVPPVQSCENST